MLGFQMHDSILVLHHAAYPDEPWFQDHSPILLINVWHHDHIYSHSSRIHSPVAFHHSPTLFQGPEASITCAFLFANPIQTRACSPLTSTLAGRTGRNWRSSNLAAGSACHV